MKQTEDLINKIKNSGIKKEDIKDETLKIIDQLFSWAMSEEDKALKRIRLIQEVGDVLTAAHISAIMREEEVSYLQAIDMFSMKIKNIVNDFNTKGNN